MIQSMNITPAGRWTRLAFQKMPLGREKRTRVHHFTSRLPRTHEKSLALFWLGLTLSVMGSITQVSAWLWMLGGAAR